MADYDSAIWAALANATLPSAPSKLTKQYQENVFDRLLRRQSLSARVEDSTAGRLIPDFDQLTIGEGKHFEHLSVLFLDICNFSSLSNWETDDQKNSPQNVEYFYG